MTRDDGGPAFPLGLINLGGDGSLALKEGMSLRDWFAGQALIGIMGLGVIADDWEKLITGHAANAYQIADAMLAERAKP